MGIWNQLPEEMFELGPINVKIYLFKYMDRKGLEVLYIQSAKHEKMRLNLIGPLSWNG